nr:MAG: DNA pilot protein [Microvirus sp.]
MAVYQVQANGQAPPGLSSGDYVNTAGGMYMVTNPGAIGAKYNANSGYWSVKADGNSQGSSVQSALTTAQKVAADNTAQSQSFAREQMSFQREQNAKAMDFNSNEAQKNRDWQQSMSNTAHQREVKDLIAAGLNPILSAMGGSGASTTSGATASGVTSSGSSGQVDTSYNSLISGLVSTILNNQTSLDIAKLQASVNQYMADSNRIATLGSAATSAGALLGATNKNNETSKYLQQQTINNPTTMFGAMNKGILSLDALWQGLFGGTNSSKSVSYDKSKLANMNRLAR